MHLALLLIPLLATAFVGPRGEPPRKDLPGGPTRPVPPGSIPSPVADSNNLFTIDLFNRLRQEQGNLFFSPFSISSAMDMAWEGARGETASEMAKTLRIAIPRDSVGSEVRRLRERIDRNAQRNGYELAVANRLWGRKGKSFIESFLATMRDDYGAGLGELDFAREPDRSRDEINAWVEEKTKSKIRDLLPPGSINPQTGLVLTNAIYFKGEWAEKFPEKGTRTEPFHPAPRESVQVPMMHESITTAAGSPEGLKVLVLKYRGGDLSMAIFLPDRIDGLADLERDLTLEKVDQWLSSVRSQKVEIALPRFRTTSRFLLADALSAMGMPSAFEPARADFSGMDGERDLFISAVVHKAFVDVNEEGTEAAAATGVVVGITSIGPVEPMRFVADHPFLLLIREEASGAILFMGRVANPSA